MAPDPYVDYQGLSEKLQEFEKQHRDVMQLESLGQSLQGREIWLATLTDPQSGGAETKPGYWIDANTHAGEVTGTQCCLDIIEYLLSGNEEAADLLQHNTFYIVPRISVDGAEAYLKTYQNVRSSLEDWPYRYEDFQGVESEDLDGDGESLVMRIVDPAGEFKVSPTDDRLMIPREPHDIDGTFYRIMPEGLLINYNGREQSAATRYGLDLNRQYPENYRPEGEQVGAGPHAKSMFESRWIVQAVTKRPNIVGLQSFHTFAGVVLRPFAGRPDSEMNQLDLDVYQKMGKLAEATAGYPCLSVHHDFRYDKKKDIGGGFFDWAYNHRGIVAFTNEIWSIARHAGAEKNDYVKMFFNFDDETQGKIVRWCDENLEPGTYYKEWTPFKHPQLGAVEIGGWRTKFVIQNPPPSFLEKEVQGNRRFVLDCVRCSPRVQVVSKDIHKIDEETFKVSLVVKNTGYLPTYGSQRALEVDEIPHPLGRLELEEGLELIVGDLRFRPSHLEGFSRYRTSSPAFVRSRNNRSEDTFEWIVKGRGLLQVSIDYRRGGQMSCQFEVG